LIFKILFFCLHFNENRKLKLITNENHFLEKLYLMLRFLKTLFKKLEKNEKKYVISDEKKYTFSKKNPWLNPKDNFGKLEKGKTY